MSFQCPLDVLSMSSFSHDPVLSEEKRRKWTFLDIKMDEIRNQRPECAQ